MTGWTDMIPAAAALSESHSQAMLNRFTWLFYAVFRQHNDIDDIVIVLGSAALLAKLRLTSGSAGQLPNDQWQSEVKHWHDISMTSMQAAFVNTAKGVNDKNLLPYVARPNNTEETLLCHSQVSLPPSSQANPVKKYAHISLYVRKSTALSSPPSVSLDSS
jgi:hypothetical protein